MKTTTFWKLIILLLSGVDDLKKSILHLDTQKYEFEVSIIPLNNQVIGAISQKNGGLNCTAAKKSRNCLSFAPENGCGLHVWKDVVFI
jgi:hypothetical protein